MKLQRTFFLVFISTFFSFQFAFSQHKYYIGIPNHVAFVRDSTRIMMDVLPWNWNGRLQENEMPRYLEPLKQFLDEHPGYKCNFLLYSGESDEEKNFAYTSYQGKRLSEYFTYVDTVFGKKYLNEIIPHRLPNPMFRDLQPDSSERIFRGDIIVNYRQCVLVELVWQRPVSKMVQLTVFYAAKDEKCECDAAPVFPGGKEGLYNFLYRRMDYSVVGMSDVSGVVLVEFDIEPDGRVSAPGIRKSLFPALDEQALRIVSDMPRWRPAIKDGRPVRCHYVIPMYYSLGF